MNEIEESREIRARVAAYMRDKHNNQPLTELPNALTTNLDMCESGADVVRLLACTDQQIFDGWQFDAADQKSQGLKTDRLVADKLARLADLVGTLMRTTTNNNDERFRVIMSGCGTSGRIAYMCSRTFNSFVNRRVCEYIIAGGDVALSRSVEAVEDRPEQGLNELLKYTKNSAHIK